MDRRGPRRKHGERHNAGVRARDKRQEAQAPAAVPGARHQAGLARGACPRLRAKEARRQVGREPALQGNGRLGGVHPRRPLAVTARGRARRLPLGRLARPRRDRRRRARHRRARRRPRRELR
eukprot:374549_1